MHSVMNRAKYVWVNDCGRKERKTTIYQERWRRGGWSEEAEEVRSLSPAGPCEDQVSDEGLKTPV